MPLMDPASVRLLARPRGSGSWSADVTTRPADQLGRGMSPKEGALERIVHECEAAETTGGA